MNTWMKWLNIALAAIGMIGAHMLFVADGRYFPLREGVEVAQQQKTLVQQQKTNSRISQEVLRGFKKLRDDQADITKEWLRNKNELQEREMENLKDKIRRLQSRPRAQ